MIKLILVFTIFQLLIHDNYYCQPRDLNSLIWPQILPNLKTLRFLENMTLLSNAYILSKQMRNSTMPEDLPLITIQQLLKHSIPKSKPESSTTSTSTASPSQTNTSTTQSTTETNTTITTLSPVTNSSITTSSPETNSSTTLSPETNSTETTSPETNLSSTTISSETTSHTSTSTVTPETTTSQIITTSSTTESSSTTLYTTPSPITPTTQVINNSSPSSGTTARPPRTTTINSMFSTLKNLYPQDLSYTCPPPVNHCKGPKDCLYRNPDCKKFYKCNDGNQAFVMDCPSGTEWNDSEKICDFPQNANCIPQLT